MSDEPTESGWTPLGVTIICLVFFLYSLLWILTWILASSVGNAVITLLALIVAIGVLGLTYFLYIGNRPAWWIGLAVLGGSTLWRVSLVLQGNPDNLLNTAVGAVLFTLLASQHRYYRPSTA